MEAVLNEQEYQIITDRVTAKVFQKIKEEYYLLPKVPEKIGWVGLDKFTKLVPYRKDKEWIRTFILARPEFKDWVFNLHPGRGRATKINADEGLQWIETHMDDIDWNLKLPK